MDREPLIEDEDNLVIGELPLTTLQKWFFEHWLWVNPDHWNIATLMEVTQTLQLGVLLQTLRYLLWYHDGLRIYFRAGGSGWRAFIREQDLDVPIQWIDLSLLPETEQKNAIEAEAPKLQASLSIQDGKLIRLAFFDLGSQRSGRLLLVFHHLMIDVLSLQIVLRDFQTVYSSISSHQDPQLLPKTTSLRTWGKRLEAYVASLEMRQEFEQYWLKLPWAMLTPLPVDYPDNRGKDTIASIEYVTMTLSREETGILQKKLRTVRTQILDVLLMALVESFKEWKDVHILYIDVPEHGRETDFDDIDLSNTLGQLALGRRLFLPLDRSLRSLDRLSFIKEYLRSIPKRGIGNNLLTFLSKDEEISAKMQSLPLPEILFNYRGQMHRMSNMSSSWLQPAKENIGSLQDLRERRDFSLRFSIVIDDGKLSIAIQYSNKLYRYETMNALLQNYGDVLKIFDL